MFDEEVLSCVTQVLAAARAAGVRIITAESCTGGLVAAALTAVPGSSDVVEGGYVAYANAAKARLGVNPATLEAHGAVSEPVARQLAEAARLTLAGDGANFVAVAVTGVAGPGGGTAAKPVGLVHFAAAGGAATVHRERRYGDLSRDAIRRASVLDALNLLDGLLSRE